MKIYKIRAETSEYQILIYDVIKLYDYDCRDLSSTWDTPEVYIDNPRKVKGDFYYLDSGVLVFNQKIHDEMLSIFEIAGQILELSHPKEMLYLLNILECVNCLDYKKSDIEYIDGDDVLAINKYAFHGDRLHESSLFKIPELNSVDIFAVSGLMDEELDFISMYKKCNFKGLIFHEVWSDE